MKNLIAFSALLATACAAPATPNADGGDGDFFRQSKVAPYGVAYGPAPVPAPAPAPYTGSPAPIVLYIAPPGNNGLHYRAEGEEGIMRHASARSYGGYAEPAAPAYAGPALGLFPHARSGGCAVPLLLSCSPNIAAGHLVKSHEYPSYSAPSYRSTEQKIDNEPEMKESSNLEEKNAWSEAERSSASGPDMQHMTSISGPHHQHSLRNGSHVFPVAFPQSATHMHEGMIHHTSHI